MDASPQKQYCGRCKQMVIVHKDIVDGYRVTQCSQCCKRFACFGRARLPVHETDTTTKQIISASRERIRIPKMRNV